MKRFGIFRRTAQRMAFRMALALSFMPTIIAAAPRADSPPAGEFWIASTPPLNETQRARLRELIGSHPEAARLAATLRADVEPLLDRKPHPVRVIQYEGLLHTDPLRIACVEKLREMGDVALVLRHWQATGDARAADYLRRFVTAWAGTYEPTGNDVNENKLYPLFVAYEGLRAGFEPGDRKRIDDWISTFGNLHSAAVAKPGASDNRYTKHLRLLAMFGRILDREDWRASAREGVRRFVAHSLRPDGTSLDLEIRDSLTYHTSSLRPIIEIALLSGIDGPSLYSWKSPAGSSIRKSVEYVVPYASGAKTREEWRNTTVELDRNRAAAGIEEYRPGRLYEPRSALPLLEEASVFDPALRPLVLQLHGTGATRFASWMMLSNETFSHP